MPELLVHERKLWIRRGSPDANDERPTVLFIHGAGGSSLTWIYQIRALRRRLDCVALDLPGHGRSEDNPDCQTIAAYADVVAEALSSLDGPVVLVGHSMGGAIALETALRGTLGLQALVLFGVGPTIPVSPLILQALEQDSELWLHLMNDLLFSPTTPRRFVAKSTASGLQAEDTVVLRDFRACDRWELAANVDLQLPTLVITGHQDAMVPVPLAEALALVLDNATFEIIDDAGHMAMLEQHKHVNEVLLDFILQQVPGSD